MLLAIVLAVPLGVLAAANRGSKIDLLAMGVALLGQSVPNFWLAIMMILLFAVSWGVLPTSGRGGLAHVVMPAAAIAINLMALLTRLVRTTMIEVLTEDYVRTGRGKGLRELAVVTRHALPNALIPLVTVVGLQFGYILGGAVVIETVFTWPGVGLFTMQAILNRDYPVVQASVFILATGVVLINLTVDLLYVWLDPRIRARAMIRAHLLRWRPRRRLNVQRRTPRRAGLRAPPRSWDTPICFVGALGRRLNVRYASRLPSGAASQLTLLLALAGPHGHEPFAVRSGWSGAARWPALAP